MSLITLDEGLEALEEEIILDSTEESQKLEQLFLKEQARIESFGEKEIKWMLDSVVKQSNPNNFKDFYEKLAEIFKENQKELFRTAHQYIKDESREIFWDFQRELNEKYENIMKKEKDESIEEVVSL